jgi:MFS family permease
MLDWFHGRIGNIYFGWWMVAIGSAVRIVAGGLHYYGSSIFFLPVSQELGLSRAATSLVFSLARAQGALEGPLAGYIIDRHGPRPVILAAMFFTGIGYMASPKSTVSPLCYWFTWGSSRFLTRPA